MTAGMLGHEVAIATSKFDGQTGRSKTKNFRKCAGASSPVRTWAEQKEGMRTPKKTNNDSQVLDVIRLWEGGQIKVLGNLCHNGHVVANTCLQPNACNQRAVKQS